MRVVQLGWWIGFRVAWGCRIRDFAEQGFEFSGFMNTFMKLLGLSCRVGQRCGDLGFRYR